MIKVTEAFDVLEGLSSYSSWQELWARLSQLRKEMASVGKDLEWANCEIEKQKDTIASFYRFMKLRYSSQEESPVCANQRHTT